MKSGKNPKPRKAVLQPAAFQYKIDQIIPLSKPASQNEAAFFKVLAERRSTKELFQVNLQQLSSLLWHSAKVRHVMVSRDGFIRTKTNSPSAGALHPIDIFVSFPNEHNQRSFNYYNPFNHSLERLILDPEQSQFFLEHINKCVELNNSSLLWFGMDFSRTNSLYENPESLLWRDAGALLMAIQLVAQALQLCSCPIGTLGEPYFSRLFGLYKLQSAGGIVIGSSSMVSN